MCIAVLCSAGAIYADPPGRFAPDEAFSARLLALAGPGFKVYETDHFSIAWDTDYDTMIALTGRIEGTFAAVWRFCEAVGLTVRAPETRLGVILFDRFEDYERFCAARGGDARGMAGVFFHDDNLSVFCNARNQPMLRAVSHEIEVTEQALKDARSTPAGAAGRLVVEAHSKQLQYLRTQRNRLAELYNRVILQHEAAHHVLFNIGVQTRGVSNPDWLTEGLACLFEVAQPRIRQGVIETNHLRLADVREAFGVHPRESRVSADRLRTGFDNGRFVPLRTMIGNEGYLRTQAAEELSNRYAQAWAMVMYLQKHRRDALRRYLEGVAARRPGMKFTAEDEIAAFEAAFGPITETFQDGWMTEMFRLPFNLREVN